MLKLFQSPAYHKPVAKAIHPFNQATTAKWVPVNKSFITLTKIILRAAAERLGLVNAAITLRCITREGYRHLLLVNSDQVLPAMGEAEEFIISTEVPFVPARGACDSTETFTLPVDFQQQRLGYLVVFMRTPIVGNAVTDFARELAAVASEIVGVIRRYQTRYRAIHLYGDQAFWLGDSLALRQLDQRLDALASSPLPVLVRANKGCGKLIAARSLHCQRYAEMVPFIESACNQWQEGAAPGILQALYAYAKGGTLFLRNIDKLSPANLRALQEFWGTRFTSARNAQPPAEASLVLTLSGQDVPVSAALAHWLPLHTAELVLPGLNARREDVRDLARFFIQDYSFNAGFDFTEGAWLLLESFMWQRNVQQLQAVIQQLALMVEGPLVTAELLRKVLVH